MSELPFLGETFLLASRWVRQHKYNFEVEMEVVTFLIMMAEPKLSRLSNFGCLRDGSESL